MNAERLKVLMTVLKTGSLSAAAEELNFTPSGISRMMAALEEEMGFPLLVRGKEGVRATAELERLMPSVRLYLFQDEKLRQEADEIRGIHQGSIVIGCAYNGIYERLEKAITLFHKDYPGIQFQLRSGFSMELLDQLRNHEIDLCISTIQRSSLQSDKKIIKGKAFIKGETPSEKTNPDRKQESSTISGADKITDNFLWKELGQDEIVLWVPAKSELASQKSLPLSVLETEPYIDIYPGKDIDNNRILQKNHIHPNVQFEAMDSYTAYSMVSAGLGVAMNSRLNSAFAGDQVRQIPVNPRQFLNVGLAFREDNSPAAARFIQFMGESQSANLTI